MKLCGPIRRGAMWLLLAALFLIAPLARASLHDATNSVQFFKQVADPLLRQFYTNWRATDPFGYAAMFGTNQSYGVSNIPVIVNGQFTYTPSVNRVLQLTANLWDAAHPTNDAYGPLPTVFRPVFEWNGKDLYITNFVEQGTFDPICSRCRERRQPVIAPTSALT